MTLKKQKERKFAEIFLEIMKCQGALIDSEPPDFIIKKSTELIGLEVTAYTGEKESHGSRGGSKKLTAQNIWREIIDSNYERFIDSIDEDVVLYIIPRDYSYPPKKEVSIFIKELIDFANLHSEITEVISFRHFEEASLLSKYLKTIRLMPAGPAGPRLAFSFGARSIGAHPSQISNIIRIKSLSSAGLRGLYSTLILLIHDVTYIEAGDLSFVAHKFREDNDLYMQMQESPYDKVFLLSLLVDRQLMELYPRAGTIISYDESPIRGDESGT
jgi:hypothetical protein